MSDSAFSSILLAIVGGNPVMLRCVENLCERGLGLTYRGTGVEAEIRDGGTDLSDLDQDLPFNPCNVTLIEAVFLRGCGEVDVCLHHACGGEHLDHLGCCSRGHRLFLQFLRDFLSGGAHAPKGEPA